jgi:F-box/leucine-rich repeat protein 2/20
LIVQRLEKHNNKQERGERRRERSSDREMDVALRDGGLVAQIVQKLENSVDRHAAAMVCRVWNEAVTWEAHKLVLRSRECLPQLLNRFWHVTALDLSYCSNQLEDGDLELAASAFSRLRWLKIGDLDQVQTKLTDAGISHFVKKCSSSPPQSSLLDHVSLTNIPLLRDSCIVALLQGCRALRSLHLHSCMGLGDGALEAIAACQGLRELALKGETRFTPSGLAMLGSGCRELLRLVLELGSLNIDMALEAMAKGCKKLHEIALKFQSAKLAGLVHCSSLQSLAFETYQRGSLDEVLLAIVAANKNLVELSCLSRLVPLSDAAVIGVLVRCPNLRKLHLEAVNLTEAALMCIVHSRTLSDLALGHFMSTGQGGIGLLGLDLKRLSLVHTKGVRDVELQMLIAGNLGLEYLDLQGCAGPSAIGFSSIGSCRHLLSLDLSYTRVDDVSLCAIACGMQNLKHLALVKCEKITNMRVLTRFPGLESLVLDQCPFLTDEGLDHLAQNCIRLSHLSLAFTNVTDIGLENLSKCQMLRSLRVPYCRQVEGEGVVAIANSCGWFHHVVLSHRLRGSLIADVLQDLRCAVCFEVDETALVPFDANMLI